MHWQDEGIILAAKRFGESSLKLDVFTPQFGRMSGLVKGGASKKRKHQFDIGNVVQASWRGRLSEQLGQFTIELLRQPSTHCLNTPLNLGVLNAMCSLSHQCLPENHAEAPLYAQAMYVINHINAPSLEVLSAYIWFEVELLTTCGMPLELSTCVATGSRENLHYLSPKSGRAVCAEAGAPYHDKLLTLPAFLQTEGAVAPNADSIAQAFTITNYFLAHVSTDLLHAPLCQARARLLEQFRRDMRKGASLAGHNSRAMQMA